MAKTAQLVKTALVPYADIRGGRIVSPVHSVVRIPTTMMRRFDKQPRHWFNPERLDELGGSMGENGEFEHPVHVTLREEGRVALVIDGERRLRSWRRKNIAYGICLIRPPMTDAQVFLSSCKSNFGRENLSLIEMADAIVELQKLFGFNQAEVAKVVSRSQGHVSNVLKVLNLHSEIKPLALEGKLNNLVIMSLCTYPTEQQPGILKDFNEQAKDDIAAGRKPPRTSGDITRSMKKVAEKHGVSPLRRRNSRKQYSSTQLLLRLIIRACGTLNNALVDLKAENASNITSAIDPPFSVVRGCLEDVYDSTKEALERLTSVATKT